MRRIVLVAAAASMFGLVGCGSSGPAVTPPESSPAQAASQTSEAPAGEEPTETTPTSEAPDAAEKFGSTATWPDGVSLTVSQPKPFKPSQFAAGVESAKKFVVVDVTLKNGSKAPVESSLAFLRATSGDAEAEGVFDSEKGIEMPSSRVMPGKSLKWRQAFGQPGSDIAITADWNFQGPVTFQ